jgi:hypothetical protein
MAPARPKWEGQNALFVRQNTLFSRQKQRLSPAEPFLLRHLLLPGAARTSTRAAGPARSRRRG